MLVILPFYVHYSALKRHFDYNMTTLDWVGSLYTIS